MTGQKGTDRREACRQVHDILTRQLGDVNRQELLPAYRAVGRLVAPRRATDEAFEDVVIEGMTEENAHDWLRRLFV